MTTTRSHALRLALTLLGPRIVPQYVRRCSPTFSAAFIAHVEASFDDDDEKNALCQAVPVPEEPLDWIRMHLHTARNQQQWALRPQLRAGCVGRGWRPTAPCSNRPPDTVVRTGSRCRRVCMTPENPVSSAWPS